MSIPYPDPTAYTALANVRKEERLNKYADELMERKKLLLCAGRVQRPRFKNRNHVERWVDKLEEAIYGY